MKPHILVPFFLLLLLAFLVSLTKPAYTINNHSLARSLPFNDSTDPPLETVRQITATHELPLTMQQSSVAIATIATGDAHTCAVTSNGGMKCWGGNWSGQLGDGTTTHRLIPTDVSGLNSIATALAAGRSHTCAVTSSGGVKCWGDNTTGQLGDGTTIRRLTPVDVIGLSEPVIAITASGDSGSQAGYTCAITINGGVKCWGNNTSGQLGDGTTITRLTPVDVIGLSSGAIAVVGRSTHTCALTSNGSVKCWGGNSSGQLGDGTTISRLTPVNASGLSSGVIAIAAGTHHTCAAIGNGGVKCWGRNYHGELGDGTTTRRLTPVDVIGLSNNVTALTASQVHTCAVVSDGNAKCWGSNSQGQLGDGTTTRRLTPVSVSGLNGNVIALSAGWSSQTCALINSGGVKCWGSNINGRLGNGTTTSHLVPVNVSNLSNNVSVLTAANGHTCAVTNNGGIKCWGENGSGQLGDGTTIPQLTPVNASNLSGATTLAAARGHTCTVINGGVKCWGANGDGQLGDGTTTYRLTPVDVVGLSSGVIALAANNARTCALTDIGGVKCWGFNRYGQLGDGTTITRLTPVDVHGLNSGVIAITAGIFHTCALTSNGGVKCWGGNFDGQLGDGTRINRLTPVDVIGLSSGVISLTAAGFGHTCAVINNGGIKCWGGNGYGGLGDGTTIRRLTPVDVIGVNSGATVVAGGGYHTCAIINSSVKCWGRNNNGQVGDGTTANRLTPVDVATLNNNVNALSVGDDHTCASTTDSGVKCWGFKGYGQLGDGSAAYYWTPVDVIGLSGINCSQANQNRQPVLMVTGWSGSRNQSFEEDDQLKYFKDHMGQDGYIEGCNLFYAQGTTPYRTIQGNASIIRSEICAAHAAFRRFNPQGNAKFNIIALSYGGLRARGYLENTLLYPEICVAGGQLHRVTVDRLFTLGTPHDGALPVLPFALYIGAGAVLQLEYTAIWEMLPRVREWQNQGYAKPTNVDYYLIGGDARSQRPDFSDQFRNLFYTPWKPAQEHPSDIGVFQSSAHGLIGYPDLYPNVYPLYTTDLHGQVPNWLDPSGKLRSYVNPDNMYKAYIRPILVLGSTGTQNQQSHHPLPARSITEMTYEQQQPNPIGPISIIDLDIGVLANNEHVTGDFEVDEPEVAQISLYVGLGGAAFSLSDPDGNLIDNTTVETHGEVEYIALETSFGLMVTYIITAPLTGTWSYTIAAEDFEDQETAYRLVMVPSTPIGTGVSTPDWLPNGTPVTITATVVYSANIPITGSSVTAQIQRPDGLVETVELFDDGNHGDGEANNGVYGAIYHDTSVGGIYGLMLTATGEYQGNSYVRTNTDFFIIAPDSATLTGQFSDQGIDENNNGLYNWLEVTAEISVTTPGTYTLSAELHAGNAYIAHARTELSLEAGSHSIPLRFDGQTILEKKLDGPYVVRNVMLLDESEVTLLIEVIDEAHTTAAYSYKEFGKWYNVFLTIILR